MLWVEKCRRLQLLWGKLKAERFGNGGGGIGESVKDTTKEQQPRKNDVPDAK